MREVVIAACAVAFALGVVALGWALAMQPLCNALKGVC